MIGSEMYRYSCVLGALRTSGRAFAMGAFAIFLGMAGVANPASAVTIDFETDGNGVPLAPGTVIVGTEWSNQGITISSSNDPLRLFNSNCAPGACSGGDDDLATGADFGNGQGFVPAQGNVLIRHEGSIANPPDDSGAAGTIRFDFDRHVRLVSIALLDNDNGAGITLNIFKNDSPTPTESILRPRFEFDNSFETFLFAGDATWVTRLDVVFPSSGAIAALTVSPVPLPAALPLLLSALALLGWTARRRRRIAA